MQNEKKMAATPVADQGTIHALTRAEIDSQIATARAFPRSETEFIQRCTALALALPHLAGECFYALKRDGKLIMGPSIRMAEILAQQWGNCRASARIVEEGATTITAQGVFHDLQTNVAIQIEVKRRITNKEGRRYNADMIAVTGNAACSIALRNAIVRGVPKAFWQPIYDECVRIETGDNTPLANRRAAAMNYVIKLGASPEAALALLGVNSIYEVTIEHLLTLKGVCNAIKEGTTTVEDAFDLKSKAGKGAAPAAGGVQGIKDQLAAQEGKPVDYDSLEETDL